MADVDLGDGFSLDWVYQNGEIAGFFFEHPSTEDGSVCGGFVPIEKGEWSIKIAEPLSIVPSIDCDRCDVHGFIDEGEWREAAFVSPDAKVEWWKKLLQDLFG